MTNSDPKKIFPKCSPNTPSKTRHRRPLGYPHWRLQRLARWSRHFQLFGRRWTATRRCSPWDFVEFRPGALIFLSRAYGCIWKWCVPLKINCLSSLFSHQNCNFGLSPILRHSHITHIQKIIIIGAGKPWKTDASGNDSLHVFILFLHIGVS